MISWRSAWKPTLVFLRGESPWTEEPGGLQSTGLCLSTARYEQISPGRTGNWQEELKSATHFILAFVKSPLSRFLEPCSSLCPRSQQWGTNGYKHGITILRHVLTKKRTEGINTILEAITHVQKQLSQFSL